MKNQVFFLVYFFVFSCYGSISYSINESSNDSIIPRVNVIKKDSKRLYSQFYSDVYKTLKNFSYDSILAKVKIMEKDTHCVLYLIESANKLKRKNNYQAMSLLTEAESVSKRLNFIRGVALSKLYKSEINRVNGDNDIAIINCMSVIALMDSVGYTEYVPWAYNEIAQIYFEIGRKKESFENNKIAYVIAKKQMNLQQMGRGLTNIGIYYADLGDYDKALSYFKECELIALNVKSDYGYALSLINIGRCYSKLEQYKTALNNYNKAIKICEGNNELVNTLTYAFLEKAGLYTLKKQNHKAEKLYKKAESLLIKVNDIILEQSVYSALFNLYEEQKKQKSALKYYKLCNVVEEEIKQKKLNKTIAELKAKNDNIKREKEIALLKKRNEMETTWNLGLFIGFAFLLFSSIMIYLELRQRKIKKEQELSILHQLRVEDELEMLQTKINPHFLYNALNSISSLTEDEPEQAEKMVLSLAELFRYSINSEEGHFTKVKQAIEICKKYLEIEKVRYGERLEYEFNIQSGTENLLIPRFLLQPLVENAIKHGISKIRKGKVKLKIIYKGSRLSIFLHDNGPPFPKIFLSGYGSSNIKKKLQILYKAKHKIQYLNKPEKIVKITIIDPYLEQPKKLNV